MNTVKITGKRTWEKDGKVYFECFCDGFRVADYFAKEEGHGHRQEDMMDRVKNMCKLIKLYGVDMIEKYHQLTLEQNWREISDINLAVREATLPEWEESLEEEQ